MAEHLDVIIVGAGLSGIGAAVHLKRDCPSKTFTILEARDVIGGTWDLFRYPGIRSDSDMFTLGYAFKPWRDEKAIADGPSILAYVKETATENGLEAAIRFRHRVVSASWSTPDARWTIEIDVTDGESTSRKTMTCGFFYVCAGYYDYAGGYTPSFPGCDRFEGKVVHPQNWTKDIEYQGKRVIVIGSGATAVTLVPELAKKASHVTMLQRSPTYVFSRPAEDKVANWMRDRMPAHLAYGITRWKNVALGMLLYQMSRRRPDKVKAWLRSMTKSSVGDAVDVDKHFNPRYNPWDQRMCLIPDGDLWDVLKDGRASIVTDTIETFTEKGIKLTSGEELEADLIVTATGLKLQFLGAAKVFVDGKLVDTSSTMNYKGSMFSDIPNMVCTFGYTNASWTLKADLVANFVCRLLNFMDKRSYRQAVPRRMDPKLREEPFVDFSSGYVQRAVSELPKQGSKMPWKLYQNYALDILMLRLAAIDDGTLQFS